MRHRENFGAAHLSAADGVVAHKSHRGVSDDPVRFAATPPHEASRKGDYARPKTSDALSPTLTPTAAPHGIFPGTTT